MFERLDAIEKKYNELNEQLIAPENLSNINLITKLSKEASDLEETVMAYNAYKKIIEDICSR